MRHRLNRSRVKDEIFELVDLIFYINSVSVLWCVTVKDRFFI